MLTTRIQLSSFELGLACDLAGLIIARARSGISVTTAAEDLRASHPVSEPVWAFAVMRAEMGVRRG